MRIRTITKTIVRTMKIGAISLLLASQCVGQQTNSPSQPVTTSQHVVSRPYSPVSLVPVPATIQLSAQIQDPQYTVGNAVILLVVVQNNSKDEIDMPEKGNAWFDFKLSVQDSSGRDVPLTRWGKRQLQLDQAAETATQGTASMNRPVSAGSNVTFQFILNRQFDMSETGVYHITLTKPFIIVDGKETLPLVSNIVVVELTEPTPEMEATQNVVHF